MQTFLIQTSSLNNVYLSKIKLSQEKIQNQRKLIKIYFNQILKHFLLYNKKNNRRLFQIKKSLT